MVQMTLAALAVFFETDGLHSSERNKYVMGTTGRYIPSCAQRRLVRSSQVRLAEIRRRLVGRHYASCQGEDDGFGIECCANSAATYLMTVTPSVIASRLCVFLSPAKNITPGTRAGCNICDIALHARCHLATTGTPPSRTGSALASASDQGDREVLHRLAKRSLWEALTR